MEPAPYPPRVCCTFMSGVLSSSPTSLSQRRRFPQVPCTKFAGLPGGPVCIFSSSWSSQKPTGRAKTEALLGWTPSHRSQGESSGSCEGTADPLHVRVEGASCLGCTHVKQPGSQSSAGQSFLHTYTHTHPHIIFVKVYPNTRNSQKNRALHFEKSPPC